MKVKTVGTFPNEAPTAIVNHVRVDVAPGLATAPAAVPTCSEAEFGTNEPHPGFYEEPKCNAATEIGTEQDTVWLGPEAEIALGFSDLPLAGKVYNLVQPTGLASYYGVALAFPKLLTEAKGYGATQFYVHGFVKGSVEWAKESKGTGAGDYHDYFEVEVSPALPLISSRQVLYGTRGEGDFITNGTNCPGNHTTFVTLKSTAGETSVPKPFTTPIGLEGCEALTFKPGFGLLSASSVPDQPNPFTTEVTDFNANGTNNPKIPAPSQVKTASITLPEGMTLNPSAAAGLEACTPAQARIHSEEFGVACPVGSNLGSVSLEVPTLPAGSFTGSMYLGGPESGPITGPPYTLYVVANSAHYGVSVRLKGEVIPNEATGQLTTVFNENPEQPFNSLKLSFNQGVLTSVANPLICGEGKGAAGFTPAGAGSPGEERPVRRHHQRLRRVDPVLAVAEHRVRTADRGRPQLLLVQPRPRGRPAVPAEGLNDAALGRRR